MTQNWLGVRWLTSVLGDLKRVLADDGTAWLSVGDVATGSAARKALSDAMYGEARLITFNPAVKVELPPEVRPKPLVWTDARVETGELPGKVMVWTPEQTGTFLDFIAHHRLYAFFHLLAHAGLRRGEGLGQYWVDFDEDTGTLAIRFQLLQVGWETEFGTPKTDSSVSAKRRETPGSTSV